MVRCHRCGQTIKGMREAVAVWTCKPETVKVVDIYIVHKYGWCSSLNGFCKSLTVHFEEMFILFLTADKIKKSYDWWDGAIDNLIANFEAQKVATRLEKRNGAGNVYLLRSGNHYKIGIGKDVRQRVKQIQTASPFPVEHLHTVAAPQPQQLEKQLHNRFAAKRVKGEWFALSPDDVAYICSL